MRIFLQVALCCCLAAGGAVAQRGGSRGGGGGGARMGGGGARMGGGFRGSAGFSGAAFSRGGFAGGGFRGNSSVFRGGFGGSRNGFGGFRNGFGGFRNGFGGFRFGFGGFWPSFGFGYSSYWPGSYDYDYGYGYDGYPGYSNSGYQPSSNVTVVYPPPAQTAPDYGERANPNMRQYDEYGQQIGQAAMGNSSGGNSYGNSSAGNGSPLYLIAFRDHSIRAAAAYWLDGRTLHYVTTQHEERQAPLDTIDRDFSLQLNRERHVQFSLPSQQ
jgi:hypothetical protein